MNLLSFPSIQQLYNVIRAVDAYPHIVTGPVKYRGKIKLNGTNAGVQIANGQFIVQSRTQIITPDNDNAGFAKWVESRREFFSEINRTSQTYTVFGEWCGPGVQKNTAVNRIPTKVFAVFAVMMGTIVDPSLLAYDAEMVTDPEAIKELLGVLPSDVHVLPWQGEEFTLNYADRQGLQKEADRINDIIIKIEESDPWVKNTFGVDGVCEGIVYVPGAGETVTRKRYSDLAFKAKGEKHQTNKTKDAAQIDPEVLKGINDFVSMFVTESRCEQGLEAVGGSLEMKNVGAFLKWIGMDVIKESKDELNASALEWRNVEKSLQSAARNWFIAKSRVNV